MFQQKSPNSETFSKAFAAARPGNDDDVEYGKYNDEDIAFPEDVNSDAPKKVHDESDEEDISSLPAWSRRTWPSDKLRSAWPHITLQQVNLLKEVFALFDTDEKGYFSKDELFFVMEAMGGKPTDAEVSAVLFQLDSDGDQLIDFPEFLTKFKDAMEDKELLNVFNQLAIRDDAHEQGDDGQGDDSKLLTLAAIERSFIYVGDNLSKDDKIYLERIFKGADQDGNGRLDVAEFTVYLQGLMEEERQEEVARNERRAQAEALRKNQGAGAGGDELLSKENGEGALDDDDDDDDVDGDASPDISAGSRLPENLTAKSEARLAAGVGPVAPRHEGRPTSVSQVPAGTNVGFVHVVGSVFGGLTQLAAGLAHGPAEKSPLGAGPKAG